jgi:23S rRNA (adenine2030-N6)-methyltransferase
MEMSIGSILEREVYLWDRCFRTTMNYRHAFHAGNFADVMKHALLVRILVYLQRKETPLRVIDTHAGIGLYDLAGDEAGRTGEWVEGIGRLDEAFSPEVEEILAPYRSVVADVRARHGDRGVFVELHPADYEVLSDAFNTVTNLKVMHLDGWTALHALVPPKEKRGLVLIDPPYEQPNELDRLGTELIAALKKWPTGVYAGWYPIKDAGPVDAAAARLHEASTRPGLRRHQSALVAEGGGGTAAPGFGGAPVARRLRRLSL